ncbi:DNA polymerase IV [Lysinibacter sp. HNR]|uniref:DNA polymerase IV n=1 Tax=Lysinibacter sp. HNR TaxID=3031408 RepID=UPI0024357329|nr:DNA polymerase IV [Lysinibacter sp. HNR]WGD38444.1 DNA polymerase IV [Lysinibacter sp. HNR]
MRERAEEASILHIDVDAFFVSVELLDKPELRGRPAVVAHETGRSVVTSATYEARALGIHSAMPLARAQRLCPGLLVLAPHMEKYAAASRVIMDIFRDITPQVEPLSIDEAFLDVSGARRLFGSPTKIAQIVRQRVHQATGLTCSVGGGASKFVAKVASQRAKPNGVLVVHPTRTLEFLHPLPVKALWGVGTVTNENLRRLGIHTIGELAQIPLHALQSALGEVSAQHLHDLARGHDARSVQSTREEKSISSELTFEYDVADPEVIRQKLLQLSLRVAARLRHLGVAARTVGIKIRWHDFRTVTRSRTLVQPTSVGQQIYAETVAAFEGLSARGQHIRLVGVRAENLLGAEAAEIALWDPYEQWRGVEAVMDDTARRFGRHTVTTASLLRDTGRMVDPRTIEGPGTGAEH